MKTSVYLLHGWGFRADIWDAVCQLLDEDFKPVKIDLWSLIGKRTEDAQACLDRLTDDLYALSEKDSIWVCWSMSALLGLNLLENYPQHCKNLVLTTGTARFMADEQWRGGIETKAFNSFESRFRKNSTEGLKVFSHLVAGTKTSARKVLSSLKPFQCTGEEETELLKGLMLMRALDCRNQLEKNAGKVKVMIAGNDELICYDDRYYLDTLGERNVLKHEDAGHALPISHPQLVVEAIKQCR